MCSTDPGIAKSQKHFDPAEVSVTACNHGCQNTDPEQLSGQRGCGVESFYETKTYENHGKDLVWPNLFKSVPLLQLLYTSAFWKSIRDLQGTLGDKGRCPETSRNTINEKLQSNSHTGKATKGKVQDIGEVNKVMPLPLPSSDRVRG